jgi:beta-glucosidase
MQAEILLTNRDRKALAHYLPKMARACDSIERTRDPKNNLFLVGPASNLLAPSYGGVRQPDGSFGPGYLAGLSVTYLAALDRMVELYMLAGDGEKLAEYERRQKITRESLPMLLAPAGYFVKSVEPGGVKHGVLGQKQFGYLEGTVNADAVALRVADDKTSESIYKQIAAFPEIRPFDFLLANAPGLDDTYWNWGNRTGPGLDGYHQFGDWVNGGAWSTVEGRAILMYYRLGKFEDVRRSATRAMKWSKDYRLDSPWSQRGENTANWWYDEGKWLHGNGIKVTVDNYAIPAATIRGLFDYDYRSDRLILRPRIPGGIARYVQKLPVRFGEKRLYLSCRNGGPRVKSVTVNGKKINVESPEEAVLPYDTLPSEAKVEITTVGGWPKEAASVAYAAIPALVPDSARRVEAPVEWPESLKKPFAVLSAMEKRIADEPGADYERAFVSVALSSFEDYRVRAAMEPGPGYFRPITPKRRAALTEFYEQTALGMYNGLAGRMKVYGEKGDARQKRLAALFAQATAKMPWEDPYYAKDISATQADSRAEERAKGGWTEFMRHHEDRKKWVTDKNVDILMIGDSIVFGWSREGHEVWNEYYGNRNAVNIGSSGDRTSHMLWHIQEGGLDGMKDRNPKAVVIMIGTNNRGEPENEGRDTAQGVLAILKEVHQRLPHSKILLLAIFPRGWTPEDEGRIRNDKINRILKTYADNKTVYWLDLKETFLDKDGLLRKDLLPDALHPNAEGYREWAKAMEPMLTKLLGKK